MLITSKIKRLAVLLTIALSGAVLTACDITQTEQGEMPDVDVSADAGNLPEYEVVKTEQGEMPDVDVSAESGKMPEYDVDMAELEVETETVDVEVPSDVDIQMPDEDKASEN